MFESSVMKLYLYAAYLDNRKDNPKNETLIRITAVVYKLNENSANLTSKCQIWFPDLNEPIISQLGFNHAYYGLKNNLPTSALMSCVIPVTHQNKIPTSISIVEDKCERARNHLKVTFEKKSSETLDNKVAICVKGHTFPESDMSIRLVEWIEVMKAFGAYPVLYYFHMHPNIIKVLDYYSNVGTIDAYSMTVPDSDFNLPYLQTQHLIRNYNIPSWIAWKLNINGWLHYQDCLYRNLYRFEFVSALDWDDIIVPVHHKSLSDMLKNVTSEEVKSFSFTNFYYLDDIGRGPPDKYQSDIPEHLHMMQHVYRANITNRQWKSISNTQRVSYIDHHSSGCLNTHCKNIAVNESVAEWQHYRKTCHSPIAVEICNKNYKQNLTLKAHIWKVKDPVIRNSQMVIKKLHLQQP